MTDELNWGTLVDTIRDGLAAATDENASQKERELAVAFAVDALARLDLLMRQRTQERDELDGAADRWTHRCVQAEERVRELEAALRQMEEPCPDCEGSGYLADGECGWCGGQGLVFKPLEEIAKLLREALQKGDRE